MNADAQTAKQLDGQVAVITGASRGIGQAIAIALGHAGATVVGTATSEQGAAAIDSVLAEQGIKGSGLALDVCDAEAVEATLKKVTSEQGPISILVNNAGITRDNLVMRMKDDEWDAVIDTNLKGVYRMSKAVLRGMMKARHGRIVNIGSVVGSTGNPGQANYAAAKAGLLGLTKSMARELGSRNITVNAVAPGFIETDMTNELPEATREALLGQISLGRLGAAEDIAAAVLFLVSNSANYISGETLHVNGGMHMG